MPRLICGYLCALALTLGCTESFKPLMSTETGNPPVIDSSKIALVVTRDEVHVRGEAGAIMPPEASVEITIERTDDATLDDVEDDGSFDVEVDATLDDVFEVRAVLNGLRSGVVRVDRGGAMVVGGSGGSSGASGMGGAGGGGMLSCEEQTSMAQAALSDALATADRSCTSDADCKGIYRNTACESSCFGGFFSDEGLASIQAAIGDINEDVCAGFEENGCELVVPPCVPPGAGYCVSGQCTEDHGGSCEACLSTEITWRVADVGVFPAEPSPDVWTLSGCNTLTRATDLGPCEVTVPQCGSDDGLVGIDQLLPLLESDDVTQARGVGGTQGEPGATAGFSYEITIDGDTFTYRTCSGVMGVECLPRGPIEELIDLIMRMTSENGCAIAIAGNCDMPFEAGECDAAIPVYWHDPESRSCVAQTYGGCGGNPNRYESLAACQNACPPPVVAGDCDADRQLREVCVECGLAGGCAKSTEACVLECGSDSDCMGELDALGSPAFCDETAGLCQQSLVCI